MLRWQWQKALARHWYKGSFWEAFLLMPYKSCVYRIPRNKVKMELSDYLEDFEMFNKDYVSVKRGKYV